MGWWSADIMGGDEPLDVKDAFESEFGSTDAEKTEDWDLPAFRVPTSQEVEDFAELFEEFVEHQAIGFLAIERGVVLSNQLQNLILDAIDGELDGSCSEWDAPEERIAVLNEFFELVKNYDGSKVELPHQRGLIEMIEMLAKAIS